MDVLDRRIGALSFARLLGDWRPGSGRGLAEQLTDRIRLLVLDGRLPLQTRVPAERELASAIGVSRTTVAATYEALRSAGILHSRRGAGSWTQLPPGSTSGLDAGVFAPSTDRTVLDLAQAALPAPSAHLRAAAAAALTDLDAHLSGHGYDLSGLPVLRAAIAERYTARGLPTGPDQIVVTSGALEAIALVMTTLVGPGDRVLVEHPTYPNVLNTIATRGARVVPVPMISGPDGVGEWDFELLTASVRDAAPRLVYLIPDFQNPTGGLLDAGCRARLVELARRTGVTLLLDETLAELGLEAAPAAPVAAFGAADSPQLITVGSASKIFWGGLRVGWIRTTAAMARRIAAQRAAIDLGGPTLEQLIVARLLADVDEIAAARKVELAAARDLLRGRLATTFPQWRPSRPAGGLSLWVDLGAPLSSRLALTARRHHLLLAAGPRFGVDGAFEHFVRLPYTLRLDRMDEALTRMRRSWLALDPAESGGHGTPIAVA